MHTLFLFGFELYGTAHVLSDVPLQIRNNNRETASCQSSSCSEQDVLFCHYSTIYWQIFPYITQ